ncbi:uncharacterized protein LOC111491570 [Cucurbita maxima]|uniref:Uncharacterized protein LOC111491570 n=1 Tax=Cucurbita maxima TaxID=3661 RepID=A0A6J1K1I9_CUCMA|nr:uncharacterized protein LOC111491570 [Cucurbita maxima]
MEFTVHSISRPNLPLPLSFSLHSSSPSNSLTPYPHTRTKSTASILPPLLLRSDLNLTFKSRGRSLLQPLRAFQSEFEPQSSSVRWLLVPVGDGDWKHIGSKVEMPDAFEIVSNEITVGRLPEKADIAIPVATVSAVHARIKKQEDRLLVIDLDSTNGTFIDDKRLKPGVVAAVSSGNCISFGDIHLAMFQVSKLKTDKAASKIQESEDSIGNSETS